MTDAAAKTAAPRPGRMDHVRLAWRIVLARPRFAVGYVIVFLAVLLALLAPLLSPYDPVEADPAHFLQPPSLPHLFGTDAAGMDIFSRTISSPRVDLTIAVAGTLISSVVGGALGAWAGYYSRGGVAARASYLLMRATDVLQAFPVFVFAIALVASLGQSVHTIVIAIAFVNIPIYLRLMRSQVLSLRDARFVEASRVAGLSDLRIIVGHIVPNAMGPALAQLSVNVGWSILLTAGLSFVGAGVRPPTPEWGAMIASGFQNVVTGQWWPSVVPGLALAITVFGFSLVGASVETFADPIKMRRLVHDVSAGDRARLAAS